MSKKVELNNSGGAEATLKLLNHIDEQSLQIQHTIWKNKPLKASRTVSYTHLTLPTKA